MSISKIQKEYDKAICAVDSKAVSDCLIIVKSAIAVLHNENFGGKKMYLCTGMGSSFLADVECLTLYSDDSKGIVCHEVNFFEYANGVKCATIPMSDKVKAAVKQLEEVSQFLMDEILTTLFPYRVYYNRIERS